MKKLYYSIGEVSDITSVEPHVLRYWETIFSELNPSKNSGGKRTYTNEHIETILKLKELIQEKKYSTAGAKKVLANNEEDEVPDVDLIALQKDLNELKLFLKKLKESI